MERIYLDHAATTPLAPGVLGAMEPWIAERCGNPSSLYFEGRQAKAAIDRAREIVSRTIGCLFGEVLFTSSGTESVNTGIIGAALAQDRLRRNRVLLGAAEHHAVHATQSMLERLGYKVEAIPVDREGVVHASALEPLLAEDVLLVAVMHANNELGTLNPVSDLAQLAHRVSSLFLCDAVQTLGSIPVDVRTMSADMMAFSAHKLGGPKGVGALYIKGGLKIKPLIVGGGQEREMRAGTENVAGILGFGSALECPTDPESKRSCRDSFLDELTSLRSDWEATTKDRNLTLPGHAHIRFPEISAESMLILLDRMGISASSGAACSSGSLEPSHVLLACGFSEREANEGLRFTFGRGNTIDEAKEAARRVAEAADHIRNANDRNAND